MSPKQVQNLAEQTPWDLKAREQSLWFDALPLDPPRVVLPQKLCQPETPTGGFGHSLKALGGPKSHSHDFG